MPEPASARDRVAKAQHWMRQEQPAFSWSARDAEEFLRLFDEELAKGPASSAEHRTPVAKDLLSKLAKAYIQAAEEAATRRRARPTGKGSATSKLKPSGRPVSSEKCIHGMITYNCRTCAGPGRYNRGYPGRWVGSRLPASASASTAR